MNATIISCAEFRQRPVNRSEVLTLAATLGWPRIDYLSALGARFPLAGESAWRASALSTYPGRRDAMEQLLAIEHRNVTDQPTKDED